MQKITKILFITASINLAACGAKQQGSLAEKKAELDKLKKEQSTITANITKLETEIAKLDTSAVKEEKTKLVAVEAVNPSTFIHNIDLQGKIESENISYITPRGQGGQVKALYIKKGDVVKKGQLILQLDDIIARRSVAATQKGIETIKTQLAFEIGRAHV